MATRREFLKGVGASVVGGGAATACVPPGPTVPPCVGPTPLPPTPMLAPGAAGLVDEVAFRARADRYLAFAVEERSTGSPTNLAAHLAWAERDPRHDDGLGAVRVEDLGEIFAMLDGWKDTGDFQLMYLHWLLARGGDRMAPEVVDAIDRRLLDFRYWYDDPLPADRVDHKWFWSENHRIIFAVVEYLSGVRLADRRFTVTGLRGDEHRARAEVRIDSWLDERARFGFSEWHSNVYMLKNITPLLLLVELADAAAERLIVRAAALLDLCFLDVALNLQEGAYGATRGRTYKKDKMSSQDEATFDGAKLLFDDTDRPHRSRSDAGAVYLAAARRYRLPEAIRRIAVSDAVTTVRERHGVHIDPHEPVSPHPTATAGYDYADPANLAFWWAGGALTTWQNLPQTVDLAQRFRLWDSDLFRAYAPLRALADLPTTLVQVAAHELASMAAAGALAEAHTVCWRSPEAMLSTVVDHRPGDAMEQSHAWQATLDVDALVFTTHPSSPTPRSTDWRDDDGYWTGTASMPRSIQVDRTAVHLYWPRYLPPTDPVLGPVFGYLPETHAYFPQDHFDEVVQVGNWTFGRRGDGFVGLWSWRAPVWRAHDPAVVATRGMVRPFDLVAAGGADNVWIVEVGRPADDGTFAAFVDGCVAAPVAVERSPSTGFRVDYRSPAAGRLEWGTQGPARRDGTDFPLRDHERLDSPWVRTCGETARFRVEADGAVLDLDVASGARATA